MRGAHGVAAPGRGTLAVMPAARKLSRVVQALGAIGFLTLVVAATVAFDTAAFHPLPLLVRIGAGAAAVHLVAGLLRGFALAGRSALRAGRLQRRLRHVEPTTFGERSAFVLDDERCVACCVGLLRPVVVISTATIDALSNPQLAATLSHEHAHARHRDPLRLLIAASAAEVLGVLPGSRALRRRYSELLEIAADCQAVAEVGNAPLAGALVAFAEQPRGARHPSVDRIDGLLGKPVRIAAPRLMTDAVLLAALGAVAASTMTATGCFDVLGRAGSCATQGGSASVAVAMVVAAGALACARSAGPRRTATAPLSYGR